MDFDLMIEGKLWWFKINLLENNVEYKLFESCCCEFLILNLNNVGKVYWYLFIGVVDKFSGNVFL